MTDNPYTADTVEARAYDIGQDEGASAASWVDIDDTNAQRILDGIEDCDPAILDELPYPDLSGEWADGRTPDSLLDAIDATEIERVFSMEDACDAYDIGFRDAVEDAIAARCRAYGATCEHTDS